MDENIDKIRELLFGDQMKALEQQLSNLENQLVQRLSSVESSLADKAEEINRQLRDEAGQRNDAIDKLEKNVSHLFDNLNGELNALRQQNDQHFAQSRTALESQVRKIEGDIDAQRNQLQKRFEQSLGALEESKVSREKLAELFGGLSKMLGRDSKDG
jgi:hypothetical protein